MPFLATSLLFLCQGLFAENVSVRTLWSDAFHPEFSKPAQTKALVDDIRSFNCNSLFAQVRKRGDAYYNSKFEPKAEGIDAAYDPLSDLVVRAHDTNAGPRIEIHAWVNTYLVWRRADGTPVQTNHPYRLHSDWLDQSNDGTLQDGGEFGFDPGHPEVQKYIFNICMDLVTNYDIDGLNLDYAHYPGRNWGYNSVSVQRFNRLFHRTGTPDPNDARWCQFRRNQVTALVRKIYLSAIDRKPNLKISVATIVWPPVPFADDDWLKSSSGYNEVFQDWRGWMEEGIIDINIPMVYLRYAKPENQETFRKWLVFTTSHKYNRHLIISPAIYLNSIADSLTQIRLVQQSGAEGVALYSHASYSSDDVPISALRTALVGSRRDNEANSSAIKNPKSVIQNPSQDSIIPPFQSPVRVPDMPWKAHPTLGHLKGFITRRSDTNTLDGTTITLTGPLAKTLTSDATGFYGAANLPPGEYTLIAEVANLKASTNTCTVAPGKVTTLNISLYDP